MLTARSLPDVAAEIAPVARFVVAVGTDDPRAVEGVAAPGARVFSWDACSVLPWTVRSIAAHFDADWGPAHPSVARFSAPVGLASLHTPYVRPSGLSLTWLREPSCSGMIWTRR